MKGVSIQFHALPEEMPILFSSLFEDEFVFKAAAYRSAALSKGVIFQSLKHGWHLSSENVLEKGLVAVSFSVAQPNLNANSLYQFKLKNPDALILVTGSLSEAGLEESWVSASTDNEPAILLWRRTVKHLKAAMLSGAIAIDPQTKVVAPMKWHKFTPLARIRFEEGLKMLPVAGNAVIQLPASISIE